MRIIFIGTGEIGCPSLRALADLVALGQHEIPAVVTQPDRPSGRGMELTPGPVKKLALQLGLRVEQPEKLRAEASVQLLRDLKPDLMIVAAYGQILSKAVLAIPRLGCVNVHASLLPKYRGASPIQGAILAGEKETGVTIMWMDEGLDTGDMILEERVQIGRRETAAALHDRLAEVGREALLKALPLIESGTAPRVKQEAALATLTKKIKKEDGHLDWQMDCVRIEARIRAMNSWPGAFCWLGEEKKMLKIFSALVLRSVQGFPGGILKVNRHGIWVGTGRGVVVLREVQLEGKRRLNAAEFARGFNLPIGYQLT